MGTASPPRAAPSACTGPWERRGAEGGRKGWLELQSAIGTRGSAHIPHVARAPHAPGEPVERPISKHVVAQDTGRRPIGRRVGRHGRGRAREEACDPRVGRPELARGERRIQGRERPHRSTAEENPTGGHGGGATHERRHSPRRAALHPSAMTQRSAERLALRLARFSACAKSEARAEEQSASLHRLALCRTHGPKARSCVAAGGRFSASTALLLDAFSARSLSRARRAAGRQRTLPLGSTSVLRRSSSDSAVQPRPEVFRARVSECVERRE